MTRVRHPERSTDAVGGQYWVVELDQRQIEVWTPDVLFPAIERERLMWRHPALSAEAVVDLPKLFARG